MKDLIDINQTLDLVKLKLYNEWLYTAHIYDEGDSELHQGLTKRVVENYIDPLNLPRDSKILDLGCGPGYFLDQMKARGYTDLTGVTLSPDDVKICEEKGHTIKKYDLSFLPQRDGYYDESVDFIFLRHALEHSPYPIFSLMEYNRVLKQGSRIYIEMPQPDCDRQHENNINHYSVLGQTQLAALLQRTGFKIEMFQSVEFKVAIPGVTNEDGSLKEFTEKYYAIIAAKDRPLDIK